MATRTKTDPRTPRKASRPAMKATGAEDPAEELVTCFMSGRVVPRSEAILVKLGPGQRVWMLPEFCNDERDRAERR